MKPPPWRQERDVYPHFTEIQTRYRDEDMLGHVNNMAIAGYHDEARNRFSRAYFRLAGDITGTRIVTAEQRVTFLAEVFHPDTLEAGCGILRIGRASYEIGQALFQKERCVGLCSAVFVSATRSRGTAPLPDNLRAALESFMVRAPEEAQSA
jgi:acyl-CoA thioester hydrolase